MTPELPRDQDLRKSRWERYKFPPAFVLGFHGCDKSKGEAVLRGEIEHLKLSDNNYDWLGKGAYFWESNPERALQFAQESAGGGRNSQGDINDPFVLGAIINLGRCFDLRDSSALQEMKDAYDLFRIGVEADGLLMPQNFGREMKLRMLDCTVIKFLHEYRIEEGLPEYDTVRADFWEGEELYPGAGFREQDHIQICVRNTASILGYFRPVE